MVKLKNGWLKEQLELASKEVDSWPEWKKKQLEANMNNQYERVRNFDN